MKVKQIVTHNIAKTEIDFYSFMWMDTSAISVVDLGESFTNYHIESSSVNSGDKKEGNPILEVGLFQSRTVNNK